jgi:taurine dioxygenase
MTGLLATFGPLQDIKRPGTDAIHVPEDPWIKVISNGRAPDGRPLGDGNNSAQVCHTDSTTWDAPPSHIAMYCRQTASPAPATRFIDMIAAYASLPEATKERIRELKVVHHLYPRQIEVAIAAHGPSQPLEIRSKGQIHPLVRRHMATTLPILYLPTRRDSIVVGWGEDESAELLDELWEHTLSSPNRVEVVLDVGDFVIWDNAAAVHGRDGWPDEQVRVMWHVSAEGEIPTPRYGTRGFNVAGLDAHGAQDLAARAYDY